MGVMVSREGDLPVSIALVGFKTHTAISFPTNTLQALSVFQGNHIVSYDRTTEIIRTMKF